LKAKLRYGLLPSVLILTAVLSVGASVISLEGSDSAPYEEEFSGVCYSDVVIQAPYSNGDDGNGRDFKVREVIVTGNFERCAGHTILLKADLKSSQFSYAFHNLNPGENSFSLFFSTGQSQADWHRLHPKILDGRLVEQGALTPPQVRLDVADISWVIASTWE
jgi:hypothetical protein